MNTTNYRHAAVVLKSLSKKTANNFLANLDPVLSQRIVMEMRHTQVTAANLREAIARLKAEGLGDSNGSESHSVRGSVFRLDGSDASENYGENLGIEARPNLDFSGAGRVSFEKKPFEFLTSYETSLLNSLFADLKVRSAAVILSTMSFEFASDRLKAMEGLQKVQVMRNIADLEDMHPAEVSDLKFAVRIQIQQMLKNDPKLNKQPEIVQQEVPKSTAPKKTKKKADVAHQLSLLQHGKLIAGLLKMPDQQVKKMLETIDTADLAPALKSCPIAVQKKVLKNMAKKPAAILSNEILKVRIDEKHRITKARRSIANAIQRLTSSS